MDMSPGRRVTLEICIDSPAAAAAAIGGGCDRLELCSALSLGGLTPSAGLVAAVLAVAKPAGVPVRAMVRPRSGGFAYDEADLALATADARALIAAGVDGLVFGATRDGALAYENLRSWISSLGHDRPALTLHRAIDVVTDPVAMIDQAVALGFDHILTSGGMPRAIDGAPVIAAMVARAAGRCTIMAGAGVHPDNAGLLVAATGVSAVHGSASEPPLDVEDDHLGFGPPPRRTSITLVKGLRAAIDDKSNLGQL